MLCVDEVSQRRKLDFMLQPVVALQESRPVLLALLTRSQKARNPGFQVKSLDFLRQIWIS